MKNIFNRVFNKLDALRTQKTILNTALDRNRVSKISKDSLLFYFGNIHSQRGQDGILSEIFRRLEIDKGLFVEFGAWDGIYLSNSRYLFEKGWDGVFIEGNKRRYQNLLNNYSEISQIKKINAYVGAPKSGFPGIPLDILLNNHSVNPNDVTFVSIDVDGADLDIFKEMGFRPPVVLLEGGFNFSPFLDKPIPLDMAWRNNQQPLSEIIKTTLDFGYIPVCFYQDLYLVRGDLVPKNKFSAISLYKDAFNFLPQSLRSELLRSRAKNEVIKKNEKDFFGTFFENPLDYES